MKNLTLIIAIFALISCGGKVGIAVEESEPTITITKKMMDNPTTINLSELVDSVSFIKLETRKEALFDQYYYFNMKYTKDFIYCGNRVFSWDGKWKVTIGQTGRGPIEEEYGFWNIDYYDGKFYSRAFKLIEFDQSGQPTKKTIRNFNDLSETESEGGTVLANSSHQFFFDGKYMCFPAWDALYFVNSDNFETERRVELIPKELKAQDLGCDITQFRDKIVYTNPIIDTIFYVKDMVLTPACKIELDESIKMSLELLTNPKYQFSYSNRQGAKEFALAREGKVSVSRALESDNYIFLNLVKYLKNKENNLGKVDKYYLCYDKGFKESKVVAEEGLIDDILGLGTWSNIQFYDEKIFLTRWPYEIFDAIDKQKEAGKKINPRLESLAKQLNESGNPIVIVAHLKKFQAK